MLIQRPRRLRKSQAVRDLIAETRLSISQLVEPVFFCEGNQIKVSIITLPGLFRFSPDLLLKHLEGSLELGIKSFALFPALPENKKNSQASESLNEKGLVPETIRLIKKTFPEATIFTDIALDPFSSDGHDGLVQDQKILNDETVKVLAQMAVVHAQAGADFVSPSDMMDGRVGAIRKSLDENNLIETGIMAYSAKYASGFYGPFRDALGSAPKFGDKKTYQMDTRNSHEAIKEVGLDIEQGADIVMVKPALSYLDIIAKVKQNFPQTPLAAYNVSGEYAMVQAAAARGMLDLDRVILEVLTSIKRAGADIIFTYHAREAAKLL